MNNSFVYVNFRAVDCFCLRCEQIFSTCFGCHLENKNYSFVFDTLSLIGIDFNFDLHNMHIGCCAALVLVCDIQRHYFKRIILMPALHQTNYAFPEEE